MKKYFIALLALVSTAYVVHTWTMTEAEEQPFLDEEETEQLAEHSEENSFLEKIKQFFTGNGNEESKIEPAASAETVLEGSRPELTARQSATRAVVPISPEDIEIIDQDFETENSAEVSKTEPLLEEEDFLTTGSSTLPENEEDEAFDNIVLPEDEQTSEAPSVDTDVEEVDMSSPDKLLEDETALQKINAQAHPEPEIQITEEIIESAPESAVQKEVDQLKKEAIQGIK